MELDLTNRTRQVGDYTLTLGRGFRLWEVSRSDGLPVPNELAGRYTDIDLFEAALAAYQAREKANG